MIRYFNKRTEDEKDKNAKDIVQFQDFCEELGFYVYPSFGTLIGIVREQDFIAHDKDIDMCFHAGESKAEAIKRTLKLYHELGKIGMIGRFGQITGQVKVYVGEKVNRIEGDKDNVPYYGDENITAIDLFSSWINKGEYWSCQWGKYGKIDISPIEGKLRNETIKIPKDYDKILTHLYGNYMKPSKEKGITRHRGNKLIK